MSSDKGELVILGAGVCGLYAALTALRAGWSVTILEKEDHAGGLAAGHPRGGNHYDFGVHMLHAFDQEIFEDIASLMGDSKIEVPLDARIRWNGRTYRYPLQGSDLIQGMPPLKLARCLLGLIWAETRRATSHVESENAEDALIDFYGAPLYEFFFETFTHRYWGIHPRELSAEFIRRKMPRLSAVDFVRSKLHWLNPFSKIQKLATDSPLSEETLHYSKIGADGMIQSLTKEFRALGGSIHLKADPQKVTNTSKVRIEFLHQQQHKAIDADHLLSTIPIPSLVELFPNCPEAIKKAADSLRYKPMVTHGLLLKKSKATDGLYTYYRDRIFHRIGEPKNAGYAPADSNTTTLIVEMTCEKGDEKWLNSDATKARIIKDLETEGICRKEDIVEWHLITNANAYPIYTNGFENHLNSVLQWLSNNEQISSTGRQGAFTYPAMHSAMRMGADAANNVTVAGHL